MSVYTLKGKQNGGYGTAAQLTDKHRSAGRTNTHNNWGESAAFEKPPATVRLSSLIG